MSGQQKLDARCINTIRFLSIDAVQKANSGHPGAPMGSAVLAYVLWDRFLKHNPQNPNWAGRDRFILSAGHASMLLYSMLYLSGYDLSLEDIKNFRQWESKTPGHPEYGITPGVEMTTGPLGQGFAHGVGMALAERWLAERFNRPGHRIIDNYTYAMVSDGDIQEGVSAEAASMAGFLGLGKLIYLFMDNNIQIEGPTDLAFNENIAKRFSAYHWQVIGPVDGLDPNSVEAGIRQAQRVTDRPSLVICKTVIGYGSPLENTADVHGAPLGEENVIKTKKKLGWPHDKEFYIPDDVQAYMRNAVERGKTAEEQWKRMFDAYRAEYPGPAEELETILRGDLPEGWDAELDALFPNLQDKKPTRVFNGTIINALAKKLPLVGGSADLGSSVKTIIKGSADIDKSDFSGRNIHFGVREHAMGSITGGMALYGGIIPYCSTFLIFVDYMRPPIRLAALMKIRALYIYSHDSIGLGEDGPTHQPIEQLMNMRAIPNLTVIRPADAAESIEAWRAAILRNNGPTALIFTRQKVDPINRGEYASAKGLHRGAYTLWQSSDHSPEIILMATGSEVALVLEVGKNLAQKGHAVRVVSFPSWELFEEQEQEYRDTVLPPEVRKRVAVEAGITTGWERYVGLDGAVVGMEGFGKSAPYKILYEKFGITFERVMQEAEKLLSK